MKTNSGLLPLSEPRARPGCYLADPRDLESGLESDYRRLLRESKASAVYGRKYWEWDFIASSAENLGLLRSDVAALGLGCGKEQLIYYFARSCGSVVATDIYGHDTLWDVARMKADDDFHRFNLFKYQRDSLKFVSADMRSVPYPDASQDFIWSTSSIEHVDTLADCYRVASEVARLLKPGGYAILTTEFTLTPSPYLLPNVNALNEELLHAFYTKNPAFEVVGCYDLSHTWGHPAVIPMPRREIHFQRPRKATPATQPRDYRLIVGHSLLTPIGFVVRRTNAPCPKLENVTLSPILQKTMDLTEAAKRNPSKAVLAELHELMKAGDHDVPLQLKMNLGIYACSLLLNTAPSAGFVRRFIDTCMGFLPDGSVQDPDFLDNLAHVLRSCGLRHEACAVVAKALPSPSAFYTHVVALAGRHLLMSIELGKLKESIEVVRPYLADFIERGIKPDEMVSIFQQQCGLDSSDAGKLLFATIGEQATTPPSPQPKSS